jgi:hypothetical protein
MHCTWRVVLGSGSDSHRPVDGGQPTSNGAGSPRTPSYDRGVDTPAEAELKERISELGGELWMGASELFALFDLPEDAESAEFITACLASEGILASPPIYETEADSELVLTTPRKALFPGHHGPYTLSWKRFVVVTALAVGFLASLALLTGSH